MSEYNAKFLNEEHLSFVSRVLHSDEKPRLEDVLSGIALLSQSLIVLVRNTELMNKNLEAMSIEFGFMDAEEKKEKIKK